MIRAGPERQEVVQAERELVPRMRINSLEQPEHSPQVHGQDMQILGDGAPQDRRPHRPESEDHDLDRRRVLRRQPERRGVLVVDLVDVLVQGTPVQRAVRPVVPGVLEDEEDGDLVRHGP